MKTLKSQSGSVLALVLIGLVAVGVLSTLAYSTYFQIARGTQDTAMRAQSSLLLTQAAYALASEATDTDSDGIAEPTAGLVAHASGDGWNVPASSGAPKTDGWGGAIKYCPWDNGSANNSASRITGSNPALPASIQLAVISAGPDKTFNTACTQAAVGTINGDDGARTLTVAQMNLGVGGTFYYADPVANVSTLPASGAAQAGVMRVVQDTQIPYLWNGSAWVPMNAVAAVLVAGAGASCAGFPLGALGRDAGDKLYMCAGSGWKLIGG